MTLIALTYINPTATFQPNTAMFIRLHEFNSDSDHLFVNLGDCYHQQTNVELKCVIETKIQILYNHVDNMHFHTVKTGCQIVQQCC